MSEAPLATAREGHAQGPYVAATAEFEPATLRTKCVESTSERPRPNKDLCCSHKAALHKFAITFTNYNYRIETTPHFEMMSLFTRSLSNRNLIRCCSLKIQPKILNRILDQLLYRGVPKFPEIDYPDGNVLTCSTDYPIGNILYILDSSSRNAFLR